MQPDHSLSGPGRPTHPSGTAPARAHQLQLVRVKERHPFLNRSGEGSLQERISQFGGIEQLRLSDRVGGRPGRFPATHPRDFGSPRHHDVCLGHADRSRFGLLIRREVLLEHKGHGLDLVGREAVTKSTHPGSDVRFADEPDAADFRLETLSGEHQGRRESLRGQAQQADRVLDPVGETEKFAHLVVATVIVAVEACAPDFQCPPGFDVYDHDPTRSDEQEVDVGTL